MHPQLFVFSNCVYINELAWLLNRALQTAGADPAPYHPVMRRLLDHAVAHGVDWEMGGIYRDGVASGEALIREKEFWQHAESLVGFLDGYATFREPRYLDAFEGIWRFVAAHMIAPDVGEWRTLLDRDGRVLDGRLGNPWKVAYHTGRSMLECAERLAQMLNAER
ncbi:MAG: AGE family epimerase/isomerase [Anaerolineae bacterium]